MRFVNVTMQSTELGLISNIADAFANSMDILIPSNMDLDECGVKNPYLASAWKSIINSGINSIKTMYRSDPITVIPIKSALPWLVYLKNQVGEAFKFDCRFLSGRTHNFANPSAAFGLSNILIEASTQPRLAIVESIYHAYQRNDLSLQDDSAGDNASRAKRAEIYYKCFVLLQYLDMTIDRLENFPALVIPQAKVE